MIRSVTVTTVTTNKTVKMTLTDPENSQGFAIISMDGLGPGEADINTSEWVTVDGSHYNSAHLKSRTISLELQYVPTAIDESVADVRRRTYTYFPIKKEVKLVFECTDIKERSTTRYYYITGYVQQNKQNIWSQKEGCSIEINCPDPYFKDTEKVKGNFSNVISLFHYIFPDTTSGHPFPISHKLMDPQKTLTNKSTIPIGAIFTLIATDVVKSPAIYNTTTGQRMQLNYDMQPGEEIVIDTRSGHKRIYLKDGKDTSKIQYLDVLSADWIELEPGENTIGWDTEEVRQEQEAPTFDITYELEPIYEGI